MLIYFQFTCAKNAALCETEDGVSGVESRLEVMALLKASTTGRSKNASLMASALSPVNAGSAIKL